MNFDFLKGRYGLQLLLIAVILIVSNLIFAVLSVSFVSYYEGLSFSEINDAMNSKDGLSLVSRYVLLSVNQIGTFLLPALVFAGFFSVKRTTYLRLSTIPPKIYWFSLLFFVIASLFINGALADLNKMIPVSEGMIKMEEQANDIFKIILSNDGFAGLATNLFFLALIPAIAEEFFFRGVLQKVLVARTKSNLYGILITAFLFSFIHFQFQTFLPRFFMGIVLGYIFLWSKSLITPIIAHFLNNAFSILAFYYLGSEVGGGESTNIYYILVSTPIFFGVGYLYYKQSRAL